MQRNATFWEDMIDENGLDIGNDGRATHHRTREGHEGESVIDMTVANPPITKWAILADNHATRSDNEVIESQVAAERLEEANYKTVVWWTLAAMTEEDAEVAEKLWKELVKERAHLDAVCSADEVEQEAAWYPNTMGNVLDTTVKKIRICSRSKSWCNPDIKKRRKAFGRENRRRRNSEMAARAKAELQKSIQQSKRKMWS
jgi:hypothetical protein